MKVLKLTLKKKPFEVMVTGEKKFEFRCPSDWIKSRLIKDNKKREYDFIEFRNGYGKDRPYFLVEYEGFTKIDTFNKEYSNDLNVVLPKINEKYFKIKLGKIIQIENY